MLQYRYHGQENAGHRGAIAAGHPGQRHVPLPDIPTDRGGQFGFVEFRERASLPYADYSSKIGQSPGAEPQVG